MNRIIKLMLVVLPLLSSITCIERNNPWDPINGCPEEVKAEHRRDQASQIEALRSDLQSLSSKIVSFLDTFSMNDEDAKNIFSRNAIKKSSEVFIRSFNDSVSIQNSTVDCSLLVLKDTFSTLDTVKLFYLDSIDNMIELSRTDSLKIVAAIAKGNEYCQPTGIYTHKQVDSIFAPFKIFSKNCDTLKSIQTRYTRMYSEENDSIRSHNQILFLQNQEILNYNDSMKTARLFCLKNPIEKVDSLKKRIENVKPGDTLFIGAGTFTNRQLDFNGKGDTAQIVIMGSPFMNTVLDSMKIFITNCKNIKFENIIIQNATGASGVKIQNNSSGVVFSNCVFKNNELYGIESAGSSMRLERCVVVNNGEGGIKIDKGQIDSDVQLEGNDIIIAHNGKNGIFSIRASINLTYATISDNDSNGVYFNSPQTSSNFVNTIFSYNGVSGVFHDKSENVNGIVYFTNCNFFNNAVKDIDVKEVFVGINPRITSIDPGFVDKDQNNYKISPSSALYNLDIGYQYTN